MTVSESDAVVARIRPDEIIALTRALVDAPSENPGGTEALAVAVLESACRDTGFTVTSYEVTPGRPNLIATHPAATGRD